MTRWDTVVQGDDPGVNYLFTEDEMWDIIATVIDRGNVTVRDLIREAVFNEIAR